MKIFQNANVFTMTPEEVQYIVRTTGISMAEAMSYVAGNKTQAIQACTNGAIDITKGAVTGHSTKRAAISIYKGLKDYAKGDMVCNGFCIASTTFETAAGVITWLPVPGKICTVSVLKSLSIGCMTIRDLCAGDPSNPLC